MSQPFKRQEVVRWEVGDFLLYKGEYYTMSACAHECGEGKGKGLTHVFRGLLSRSVVGYGAASAETGAAVLVPLKDCIKLPELYHAPEERKHDQR